MAQVVEELEKPHQKGDNWSKDLKEERGGNSIPGRGNSKCKGSEVGPCFGAGQGTAGRPARVEQREGENRR
jgi:hypothetical protein